MGFDDLGWTVAPARRAGGLRVAGLTVFWLGVLGASVAVGWILAEGLSAMWTVPAP